MTQQITDLLLSQIHFIKFSAKFYAIDLFHTLMRIICGNRINADLKKDTEQRIMSSSYNHYMIITLQKTNKLYLAFIDF